MLESPGLLLTILAFLLLLGPLVVVHELGHYLVARWFGVRSDVFAVGFGKELIGRTDKHGTRWKLCALPLGGYVQFAGDANAASMPDAAAADLPPEKRKGLFQFAPLWQRSLIVAAGPVTNLLFALAIFVAFFTINGKQATEAKVAAFEKVSDAREAGVRVGDRIVAIDGNPIESFAQVSEHVSIYPGRMITVQVNRGEQNIDIPVKLRPIEFRDQFGNESKVADLGIDYSVPVVAGFGPNSAAERAGVQREDEILAIDGQAVSSFGAVRKLVVDMPGKTVALRIMRGDQEKTIPVKLGSVSAQMPDGKQKQVGQLGIIGGRVEKVGIFEALSLSVHQTAAIMRMMVTGLGQIISGERSVKELGGPIKIAKFSGEQLSLGLPSFVFFSALISINLAFINLLPIPALDGGHLAFYAAEAVRRKPVSAQGQEWAFRMGMALLLAFMLFVTVNDVASLANFGG